jgi:hypothetical protein
MKRVFWLGIGLAVGVLVVRAVNKRARAYSPSGIAAAARDSGRNLFDSVRDFVDDVRDGMHEREQELHAAFADGVMLPDEPDGGSLGSPDSLDDSLDDFDERYGGGPPAVTGGFEPVTRDPAEGNSR